MSWQHLHHNDTDDNTATDTVPMFHDINITPFTDVILVLLIVFMVSSSAMVDSMRNGQLDINLPQAGSASKHGQDNPTLLIGMAADGRLFVDEKFISNEALALLLQQTHAKNPQTVVIVDADGQLQHRKIVTVIDQIRAAGFNTVGIGTETGTTN